MITHGNLPNVYRESQIVSKISRKWQFLSIDGIGMWDTGASWPTGYETAEGPINRVKKFRSVSSVLAPTRLRCSFGGC